LLNTFDQENLVSAGKAFECPCSLRRSNQGFIHSFIHSCSCKTSWQTATKHNEIL